MKKGILLALIITLIYACSTEVKKVEASNQEVPNGIVGTWKMFHGEIRENDSIQLKDLSETTFIKIINESHFAFINQHPTNKEDFFAGAGTYTIDGADYVETLEFIGSLDFRNHKFPFTIEIKGDTLIQQGHEKIEGVGVDRFIVEKYIRTK